MDKRQAFFLFLWTGAILAWISSCVPTNEQISVPTRIPVPVRVTETLVAPTSTPVLASPSPTPEQCSETRGQVQGHAFDAVSLPHFNIYLPPCYDFYTETRYPVLYLLHGATFTDEQWIRLGVAEKSLPFIIVLPYEKYSLNAIDQGGFSRVFIEELLPFIDENYRTIADEKHRAIGGISRGGGWAIHFGLTHWYSFGAFGAHSPAIFYRDNAKLDDWLAQIPTDFMPRIYIDAGDEDQDRAAVLAFVNFLAERGVSHQWHLFTGLHDENYWRTHLDEYLRWYAEGFSEQ